MTIIETAKLTSKGQITVPNRIRKFLHLQDGAAVAFGLSKQGILLLPCKVTVDSRYAHYTHQEWSKIEKSASLKGKTYKSASAAKKHIKSL